MRTLYVFPLLLLLGCNNIAADPDAEVPVGNGVAVPASCTQLPTEAVAITTEAELIAEVAGIWSICDQSAFGTTDDAGIEILANHKWYTLYESGGQFVRATEPDKKGTWHMSIVSPMDTQLTLTRETGGYNPMGVAIGHNPKMMFMENSGFYEGWYQWVTGN